MFGQTRRRTVVEPYQLIALGPIRVETEGSDSMVRTIAVAQEDAGGLIQAQLVPVPGARILVVLRYAGYRFTVGRLPEHVVSDRLYSEVVRLVRHGNTVACPAEVLPDGDGGHHVWLNHPQFDEALAWLAHRPVREA